MIERTIQHSKSVTEARFDNHVMRGLYWLKIHLLDHVLRQFERYRSLELLDGSLFRLRNMHIKTWIQVNTSVTLLSRYWRVEVMDEANKNVLKRCERRDQLKKHTTAKFENRISWLDRPWLRIGRKQRRWSYKKYKRGCLFLALKAR